MDIVDSDTRSRMMASIKGKDTKPEKIIRKILTDRGLRYRLHGKYLKGKKNTLPGKPDIVLTQKEYRTVIFVNGCFWHAHKCNLFKWPKTRPEFWKNKISGNHDRDKKNIAACQDLGWRTLVIWECAFKGKGKIPNNIVINRLSEWLKSDERFGEIRGEE